MAEQAQAWRANGESLIQVRQLVKVYEGPAGGFMALKAVDAQVERGEFVAVVGKSGCGKSTLINMLTGIDRPTSGEVWIDGTPVHDLNENKMAEWRGRSVGIVFQHFQLLPTLSLLENVMLPMELNGMYSKRERRKRASELLDLVEMIDHIHKLPSAISGGQQQRVAIARALANDPPLVVADEPTGNLDSKTADTIFLLFKKLVSEGKTILVVTHDDDLAKRVDRTIILSDGQIVNEYVAKALAALNRDQLDAVVRLIQPVTYPAGANIVSQGEVGDKFYIIVEGRAEVFIEQPGGTQVLVNHLEPGQYFGEMALAGNGFRTATVRASAGAEVSAVALDRDAFIRLVDESPALREELFHVIDQCLIRDRVQTLVELDEETLDELTQGLEIQSYVPGQVIIRQGTLGETFYLIVEGEVEVVAELPDGTERVINQLKSGQYFGEIALLGSGRRTVTVRAGGTAPVKVVEMNRAALDLLYESDQLKTEIDHLVDERLARSDRARAN
jgi:ABC-type lipoprotein export system ATPase subunit/CRP-like cAMP-binding protein